MAASPSPMVERNKWQKWSSRRLTVEQDNFPNIGKSRFQVPLSFPGKFCLRKVPDATWAHKMSSTATLLDNMTRRELWRLRQKIEFCDSKNSLWTVAFVLFPFVLISRIKCTYYNTICRIRDLGYLLLTRHNHIVRKKQSSKSGCLFSSRLVSCLRHSTRPLGKAATLLDLFFLTMW